MLNHPIISSFVWFALLWVAARVGARFHRLRPLSDEEREDFAVVQTATLTLLGLIIGFSFSMATARYDLRKSYEEAEANAIGTEYVRAGLLPAADTPMVQAQLKKYLQLRVRFYTARGEEDLQKINADTAQLQTEMWNAVQAPALAQPTPVMALAVAGMNDVLNSQGYTQAAMWNRIPVSAWGLMIAIAVFCSLLVGYGAHNTKGKAGGVFVILPLVVSIAFLLIADIDSPRRGLIHVVPQNLQSLSQSLSSG